MTEMALRKTHYELLGVSRDASSVEIAAAFRDKHAELKAKDGGDSEALDDLRAAYQTLASPTRRAEYEETLAPLPGKRPSRPAEDADIPAEGIWGPRAIKYLLPLVVLVIAVWGWRSSHKAPEAKIVATQVISEPTVAPVNTPAPAAASPSEGGSSAAGPASASTGSRSAEQVFADVAGSVVRVQVSDASGRPIQQGSGVVIGYGKVITNCHVAIGGAKVAVKIGAEVRPATISVADEALDLCSLDVSGIDAPAVSIGSVSNVRIGQRVYAIGAPLGLELTISEGIVSSLREVEEGKVIQTTAPVSPGSSGGGLFNGDGQLVGIVTFQKRYGQNLNFAVPADWIADMRTRAGAKPAVAAAPPAAAEQTVAEMVVGQWWCFGSLTGRNGNYTYEKNGMLRIVSNDGRNFEAHYSVAGRRVQYYVENTNFDLEIESITANRMVQLVGEGHRLACDRR